MSLNCLSQFRGQVHIAFAIARLSPYILLHAASRSHPRGYLPSLMTPDGEDGMTELTRIAKNAQDQEQREKSDGYDQEKSGYE